MDAALGHMRTPPALVLREHACARRGPWHSAAGFTPRRSLVCHTQQMRAAMIQHSASGDATESGEVSDSAFSMPAAAMLDARSTIALARSGHPWDLPPNP